MEVVERGTHYLGSNLIGLVRPLSCIVVGVLSLAFMIQGGCVCGIHPSSGHLLHVA